MKSGSRVARPSADSLRASINLSIESDQAQVAVGRAYVDATPTSGTLFVGGGRETLEVAVRCEPAP